MRTAVVVQARTGSTRLPGKVLLPVAGAPMLQRMLERVLTASAPFELVVATTTDPADDAVVALCRELDVRSYRGHPTDLLDRHLMAARELGTDCVVKIPSDCPLVDPRAIDLVLEEFVASRRGAAEVDYASNLHPASWPDGHDVEAMSIEALEIAWREASAGFAREHTTPFLWDQPERFRCVNVVRPGAPDLSMTHRMTVDYPEDYAFVTAVHRALHREGAPPFSLEAILDLLAERPEIAALNARFVGVNWYRHHLAELRTIRPEETRCSPI